MLELKTEYTCTHYYLCRNTHTIYEWMYMCSVISGVYIHVYVMDELLMSHPFYGMYMCWLVRVFVLQKYFHRVCVSEEVLILTCSVSDNETRLHYLVKRNGENLIIFTSKKIHITNFTTGLVSQSLR